MEIKIKYFDREDYKVNRLEKVEMGDWIDLYAAEDVFVPSVAYKLESIATKTKPTMIPLGVAMQLPEGYEGYLLPRSSTFKTWGIIQTNSMGIIDNSYCGDNDQWMMPVVCLAPHDSYHFEEGIHVKGSWVRKGDKVAQFRIQKKMDNVEFVECKTLGNADRGGFGSTGSK